MPLDLAHLRRYTLGDRSLEREILGLFVDQLAVSIAALRQASSEKAWKMATHTLKGSSRAVGAWALGDLAEQAERLHPPPEGAARGTIVAGIEAAATEARAYIGGLEAAA